MEGRALLRGLLVRGLATVWDRRQTRSRAALSGAGREGVDRQVCCGQECPLPHRRGRARRGSVCGGVAVWGCRASPAWHPFGSESFNERRLLWRTP